MAKWFYQRNGVTHGPVDSTQLKRLAQAGELIPDDLLRREDMQSWTKASKVQGLFGVAGQVARQQSPSATPAVPASDEVSPSPTINTAATSSSSDGKKSKLRRNVIIGVVVLLVVGFIGHVVDLRKMNATYAEATSLWDAGQKQQAIALYHTLKDREELRDEKRQVLFQRLVDHEVANGSMDVARQLLQQAMQAGVVVTPGTSEGQKLLAAIQAEAAAKAEQERKASAKSDGKAKAIVLDAKGVEDLIDNPDKYAGKVVVLNAEWNGAERLREGGEGFYWPFRIGGDLVSGGRITARRTIKIRISSSDTQAEFESLRDLPDVGTSDKVSVKILFDGDFENCRLLTLSRR